MSLSFKSIPLKEFLESHNKDYADSKVFGLEEFKEKVSGYLESFDKNKGQNEKAIVANVLAPFFESLGFQVKFAHKHKGNSEIDLALLKDSNVEIIIETKKPENRTEMLSESNPNCKALHECILYYFRERENGLNRNTNIQFIIITDFYQFYLFEAGEFKRHFYDNSKIKKLYKDLESPQNSNIKTQEDFYRELKPILEEYLVENREGDLFNIALKGLHFDLRNDKHLNTAHKILNRDFLHREYKRDPNALNPKFYYELLHILGLKEIETRGKILIQIDQTQKSSFAKHITDKLKNDNKPSDFETAMSHIIVWLNRILFLKLIEANLLHFNDFDKNLRFLTSAKITSFSILAHLFFEVLAKDYAERKSDKGFNFLPYLNSSLFIRDEKEICDLSTLEDTLEILPFATTQTEYKKRESVRFLAYLFDFLECFDFGKNHDSNISNKLINSSVLGAMFEKLNGYQEGSFYTPNFITSYMCKESLQKIVLEKFNAQNPQWNAKTLEDIDEEIQREKRKQRENSTQIKERYKKLLEGIKICDPSVGSGHFLVSALSEMVSVYYRLGLLEIDCEDLRILDDEIYLTKGSKNFTYQRPEGEQDKNHQIQKELFELKKSIIENNLFGVDINPNSCNIARLRLWIELLKNAYYLNFSKDKDSKIHKLQTLPNIDINIKCGNSLISYFDMNSSLSHYPNIATKMKEYKQIVQNYKEGFYDNKAQIDRKIKDLLQAFRNFCFKDKFKKQTKDFETKCEEYSKKYGNFLAKEDKNLSLYVPQRMFIEDFDENEAKKEFQILQNSYNELFNLESNNPLEWRFAFPEVLDSNGDFLGFDLVIGNPPYIRQEEIKELKPYLQKAFSIYKGTSDIYTYFYELGLKILKDNGILSFITSNKWCRAAYGEPLREFLLKNTQINTYLDFNGVKVFESATVDTSILEFHKAKANASHSLNYANPKDYNPKENKPLEESLELTQIPQDSLSTDSFIFTSPEIAALKAKIEKIGTPLKDWDININYGIKTGYNEAFIIDTKKREEILNACANEEERARTKELIKPILRGRDIKRYSYEWAGLWIIGTFPALKLDIDEYPAVKSYLESFMPRIAQSGEKGCRKKTSNKWFETQDNIAYYQEFAKPKIVYSEIVREPQFYLDNGEFKFGYFYAEATSFILSGNKNFKSSLEYLLGLLHSKLCTFAFKEFYAGGGLGESGYRYKKAFLENLPIPKITQSQEAEFIAIVQEIIECKKSNTKQNATLKDLESRLDSMVFSLYGLDEKEINIIVRGGAKYSLAYLLLACVESQLIVLVKSLCKNFELELKEAFKFCGGLQVPNYRYEGKIIYPETTQNVNFMLDKMGYFLDKTAFMIKGENLTYLNAVLTSKTIFWYLKQICSTLGESGFSMSKIFVEKLPVVETHKIDSKLLSKIEVLASEILESKAKDNNCDITHKELEIDKLIYELYKLNDEEISLIESTFANAGGGGYKPIS